MYLFASGDLHSLGLLLVHFVIAQRNAVEGPKLGVINGAIQHEGKRYAEDRDRTVLQALPNQSLGLAGNGMSDSPRHQQKLSGAKKFQSPHVTNQAQTSSEKGTVARCRNAGATFRPAIENVRMKEKENGSGIVLPLLRERAGNIPVNCSANLPAPNGVGRIFQRFDLFRAKFIGDKRRLKHRSGDV